MQNPLEEVIAGAKPEVRWMKHQRKGGWFADPFVLDVTDTTITLLAEEFRFKTGKGRIVRLDVDRETLELEEVTVLIDDCHLSFPFVLLPIEYSKAVGARCKVQGAKSNDALPIRGGQRSFRDVMVFPETGKEGQWRCYLLDVETNECVMDHVVCEEPLVDAVIYENNVFATTISGPNGKILGVYEISENGFQLVRTITFDEKVARNAGAFFKIGEKVYRPAQECNEWYGHALSIQEFKNGEFKEVRRIPGFHTLNSYQGVTVVDGKLFQFQWVYRMIGKSDL